MGFLALPWIRSVVYGGLAVLGIFLGIWWYGEHNYHLGEDHITSLMQATVVKVHQGSTKITERIVTEYVPQIVYIQGKTQTLTKEVTKYVTQKDDSTCLVPNSFVWLWNNANQMRLPSDSSRVSAGASNIVLSDIEAEHIQETGICLANEARIRATTQWLKEQKTLYDK